METQTVTVRLTRDSVAAGDDAYAPHERYVEVRPFQDPLELVGRLYPGYLARVAGGGHVWSCALNGQRTATIWDDGPEMRAEVHKVTYGAVNHVHFTYTSARRASRLATETP